MTRESTDQTQHSAGDASKKKRRRRFFLLGGLSLAAVAGLMVSHAWAHKRGFGFSRARTAQELRERLGRGAEFAFERLDATDQQRAAIEELLDRAAPEFFTQRSQLHALRGDLVAALEREDAEAVEVLRRRGLALADASSRQWLQLVQEAYAVLDEEQRELVREHLRRHEHRHGPGDLEPGSR